MHVCFLNSPIEYYSPISGGAVATIIMQSARQLIAAGHKVTVLTVTNDDETYPVGDVVRIVNRTRADLPVVARKAAALRSRLAKWDWPYYQYYRNSFQSALKQLSQRGPAPDAVVVFNDLVSPIFIHQAAPRARVYIWLQNEQGTHTPDISRAMGCTDRILTCSRYIRDWTVKRYGIPESKFTVVHSGVDLDAFTPRSDYDQQATPLRALFIGRIDPNKGPDIAADAVGALQREGFDIRFTVAGGLWFYGHGNEMADPYFRALKEKTDAVGGTYAGHVTRPNVPALVREHDVAFVLSRSNEPFGLVALETMAAGCAVIASSRGGLPESCGGAALLVDPDDFDGVVGALRSLAGDPGLLAEVKRRSVERAGRASWASVCQVLEPALMGEQNR